MELEELDALFEKIPKPRAQSPKQKSFRPIINESSLYPQAPPCYSSIGLGALMDFVNPKTPEKLEEKLGRNKTFLIAKFEPSTLIEKKKKQKKAKYLTRRTLSAKEKKRMNLFNMKTHTPSFESLVPLNILWEDYIAELIGNEKKEAGRYPKLLRADYHGARISVLNCTCSSSIGLEGIVVKDSMRTFQFVTELNEAKIILKQTATFGIHWGKETFRIVGEHFVLRPSDRSKLKVKEKPFTKVQAKLLDISKGIQQ